MYFPRAHWGYKHCYWTAVGDVIVLYVVYMCILTSVCRWHYFWCTAFIVACIITTSFIVHEYAFNSCRFNIKSIEHSHYIVLWTRLFFVTRHLLIGDYKCLLWKGLVYCLYLFRSRNIQIFLIGVKWTSKTCEKPCTIVVHTTQAIVHGFFIGFWSTF